MIQFSDDYNAQTIFDQVWEAPYSWFKLINASTTLPTLVTELDDDGMRVKTHHVTVDMMEKAVIEVYLNIISKRTGSWATNMANWLQDFDVNDVDAILQWACFGEIRYG